MHYLFLVLFEFIFTYFFIYKIIPFLKKGFTSLPNERSSHIVPTPTGGGLVFVIIICLSAIYLKVYKLILLFPLSLIGFIDDKYTLPNILRYLFQVFTVIALLFLSFQDNYLFTSLNYFQIISLFFLFLLIFTGIINFINFMDGIDGLVASCMIIIFTFAYFTISSNFLIFIGPLVGFLFFNWNPAKVFMGDVGSTFLGGALVYLILSCSNLEQAFSILLISFPLIGDAFFTLLKRFLSKQNIFKPHKLHLYQRLYQGGLSHSKISMIYIFSTLYLIVSYLFFGIVFLFLSTLFLIIFAIKIDKKYAMPFNSNI